MLRIFSPIFQFDTWKNIYNIYTWQEDKRWEWRAFSFHFLNSWESEEANQIELNYRMNGKEWKRRDGQDLKSGRIVRCERVKVESTSCPIWHPLPAATLTITKGRQQMMVRGLILIHSHSHHHQTSCIPWLTRHSLTTTTDPKRWWIEWIFSIEDIPNLIHVSIKWNRIIVINKSVVWTPQSNESLARVVDGIRSVYQTDCRCRMQMEQWQMIQEKGSKKQTFILLFVSTCLLFNHDNQRQSWPK